MLISTYKLYERGTGKEHEIKIVFNGLTRLNHKEYAVIMDGETVGTHRNEDLARNQIVDIAIDLDLTNINRWR